MTGAAQTRLQVLWPWLALFASGAMLAGAHAFETFGRMPPCPLCLRQREVYWAAIAIAVLGLAAAHLMPRLHVARATAALLAVAFLAGAGVAFYHAGVEYKFWPGPASCGVQTSVVTLEDMTAALNGPPRPMVRCDEAPWSLFGVSMAGYNGLISLGLAGLSLMLAFVPARQDEAKE
jgi:disulfide bond formation protein DsbB